MVGGVLRVFHGSRHRAKLDARQCGPNIGVTEGIPYCLLEGDEEKYDGGINTLSVD